MRKDLITERLKLNDVYPERAKEVAKEYGLKAEEIELVRKGVVSEKVEADKEEKSVVSYINTASKDRDNEVIDPQGAILTNYRKNPVVPWGHDYRGLPVGKNIWVKKDKNGLIAKTVFLKHPFASDVGYCYTEDVMGTGPAMKAWSIGFIPLKWEENPDGKEGSAKEGEKDSRVRRRYNKWELVEYSAVMVPSNPEALTVMVEKGLITSDKLKKDIAELVEIESGTPFLYTNEAGTLVTQEEILDEWTEKEVVTKPEETDEYIRLPAKGEEGKHKGHKIRWITVSEKQGIKGIYCIDDKIIITYVFLKSKGWTLEKAKKWMEDHGKAINIEIEEFGKDMSFEEIEELIDMDGDSEELENEMVRITRELKKEKEQDGEVIELENDKDRDKSDITDTQEKGVIPFKDTGKAPEDAPWDGPKEIREAEVSDLKIMATWFDSENPDVKGAYKLPHHQAKGHKAVWRGIAASMAVLFGARGGVQVPAGDRKGIYNHLSKEYKRFDKEPPEFREYTEEELKEVFPEISDEIETKEPTTEQLTQAIGALVDEVKFLKEGRVLSEKNRKLIRSCVTQMGEAITALNALMQATEPPKQEEIELEIEEGKKEQKKAKDNKLEIDVDKIQNILENRLDKLFQAKIDKERGKVS